MNPQDQAQTKQEIPPNPQRPERVTLTSILDSIAENGIRQDYARELIQTEIDNKKFEFEWRLARTFADSGEFELIKGKTPEQAIASAMAKIQMGKYWGINPADSMRFIRFDRGKPVLENEIIAAKLQEAGWEWDLEFTEDERTGRCTGCALYPKRKNKSGAFDPLLDRNGKQVVVEFGDKEATIAMIYEKEKWIPLIEKWNFRSWAADMYYTKVIARFKRRFAPGVLVGARTMDEVGVDFEPPDNTPAPEPTNPYSVGRKAAPEAAVPQEPPATAPDPATPAPQPAEGAPEPPTTTTMASGAQAAGVQPQTTTATAPPPPAAAEPEPAPAKAPGPELVKSKPESTDTMTDLCALVPQISPETLKRKSFPEYFRGFLNLAKIRTATATQLEAPVACLRSILRDHRPNFLKDPYGTGVTAGVGWRALDKHLVTKGWPADCITLARSIAVDRYAMSGGQDLLDLLKDPMYDVDALNVQDLRTFMQLFARNKPTGLAIDAKVAAKVAGLGLTELVQSWTLDLATATEEEIGAALRRKPSAPPAQATEPPPPAQQAEAEAEAVDDDDEVLLNLFSQEEDGQ